MRNQSCRVLVRRLVACLAALALALAGPAAQPLQVAASSGVDGGVSGAPPPQGGLYKDLDDGNLARDGQERHHAIATKVLEDAGYATPCGPAIRMEVPDHQDTASWGNGEKRNGRGEVWTTAQEYRDRQAAILADASLSEGERFRRIMQMDIDNIHDLFGAKYDAAIAEMLERYDQLRAALDARGLDWKSLSSGASCDPPPPPGGGGREQPGPVVSPASQHATWENSSVGWTVEVARNPAYDQTLQFDFGDGASTSAAVPRGEGTMTLSFAHDYHMEGWVAPTSTTRTTVRSRFTRWPPSPGHQLQPRRQSRRAP